MTDGGPIATRVDDNRLDSAGGPLWNRPVDGGQNVTRPLSKDRWKSPSDDDGETKNRLLRNTVRKIFCGQRMSMAQSRPPSPTIRHLPSVPQPMSKGRAKARPPRIDIVDPVAAARSASRPPSGSPYAFPQSARLKPLNLQNPFVTGGLSPRRPSVAESGHTNESAPVKLLEAAKANETDSQVRSRSAGDLNASSPSRKRSDEIRYWRESLSGNKPEQEQEQEQEDKFPTVLNQEDEVPAEQEQEQKYKASTGRKPVGVQVPVASGPGPGLPQDLEERVSRLEMGLDTFQHSLKRLQADRNRHTVVVSTSPQEDSSFTHPLSPSQLAESLYNQHSGSHMRCKTPHSATSSLRPRHAHRLSAAAPTMAPLLPVGMGDSCSSSPVRHSPGHARPTTDPAIWALYEMLANERSARRQLQMELDNVRNELSDLHFQMRIGSARNSMLANGPMSPGPPPKKFQHLMRETERNPLVSRFSISVSDSGSEMECPTSAQLALAVAEKEEKDKIDFSWSSPDDDMF
ncbi:hypothetical protein K470DRAFT_133606 [Piedraia hortae CBS 480.64]|uniref:Uncharacterized protein n=1 Tax=Piedraia hortae CBS 480.64 TaxID=1314780 RepID=A0A6A7BTH5_9PEZI|nr:hypothetical protein K470DRAFT_133606 [Piedraia hortae CBS 480.64]